MKVNKENFGWIFSCVMLAIALVVSIILGYTGYYFKTQSSYNTDMKVGDSLQLDIRKNQANSISVNLDGSYLPGQKIKQDISVKNLELEEEIYIRVKVFIYSTENNIIELKIEPSLNWKENLDDGYYYYNQSLLPQNKTMLTNNLLLDENQSLLSSKKYIVTFLCESMASKENAESLWNIDYSTFFA